MHLVTFTFEVHREDQEKLIETLGALRSFWEREGIAYALYQDQTRTTRFVQTLLTEKSVDEISRLIQETAEARSAFELIKNASGHVVVSFLDRVV